MADTTFVDQTTTISADWLNAVNDFVYGLSTNALSVLNYGADGTGVADCCLAVQAAHDALPSNGGVIIFPPGKTFSVVADSVGAQITITKPCTIIADGATFNVTATATPTTWAAEQHNAIFRVSQVTGFTWRGGTVNGGRGNATKPWVGFIVGHGCSQVDISGLRVYDLDHADGAVRMDCLLADYATLVNQVGIKIHHCHFERCSYGPYVIGSVTDCQIYSNTILDGDIQNPQSGHIRGWSGQPALVNYVATIAVYGFDSSRASTAGPQRGVKIYDNFIRSCTQGPVCYNDLAYTKAAGASLDCVDVEIYGNTVQSCLTGIHVNGWEQGDVHHNSLTRLATASFAGYAGTAYISTTASMSGAMVEIATSGLKLSAIGNNILGYWPLDGTTDLGGSVSGVLIGIASQSFTTGQRECTAIVQGNYIDNCFTGVLEVGVRGADVSGNRFINCKSTFTSNLNPKIAGVYSEGVFRGNMVILTPYTGTKVSCAFKGGWDVTDNEFIGNSGGMYSYITTHFPGLSDITIARNKFRNATQGIQINLNSTTGSITTGTNTLTLVSAYTFTDGQTINVAGAGVAGATLTTTITSGAGTVNLVLGTNASTTVVAAVVGGATAHLLDNEFTGIGLPIEIAKDQFGVVREFGNRYFGSTTVHTFTAGSGTHGTYTASYNVVPTGGWSNDSTALIPSDIGYRAAAPGSGTWNLGCRAYNTAPSAAGTLAWVCTTAGAPGTWTAHTMP
jgi:hypothetical protein